MVIMEGGNPRYRLDLYVNIQNLFNNANFNAFVGNQLSPVLRHRDLGRRAAESRARSVFRFLGTCRESGVGSRE